MREHRHRYAHLHNRPRPIICKCAWRRWLYPFAHMDVGRILFLSSVAIATLCIWKLKLENFFEFDLDPFRTYIERSQSLECSLDWLMNYRTLEIAQIINYYLLCLHVTWHWCWLIWSCFLIYSSRVCPTIIHTINNDSNEYNWFFELGVRLSHFIKIKNLGQSQRRVNVCLQPSCSARNYK